MSKAEGKKIAVKFTMPLVGDVSGNVSAFSVTGQEYQYVNGPKLDKSYTVDSVERALDEVFYQENFVGGTADGIVTEGGLILGVAE